MEEERKSLSVEEIENTLCQIKEIKAVRIVVGREDAIEEIHVLADTTRGAKQLARDVESMLMAKYGLPINHKKISIVQLGAEEIVSNGARLQLLGINTEITGIRTSVSVALKFNSSEYQGMAKGPTSQSGRVKLIALATLDAVGKFLKEGCQFVLEDVDVVSLGRERVAVACIALITPAGEETFSGSSLVKRNESDAVVKATLNAINRRFANLKPH